MPTVTVTTEEVLAAHEALQSLTVSGERLPPQLALTLATLQRRLRTHAVDARAVLQGYVEAWGVRDASKALQMAPAGGVLIAPEHHAEFRAANEALMSAKHEVDAPTLRIADWPAHAAPTYGTIAALLPFLADADGAGTERPPAP